MPVVRRAHKNKSRRKSKSWKNETLQHVIFDSVHSHKFEWVPCGTPQVISDRMEVTPIYFEYTK